MTPTFTGGLVGLGVGLGTLLTVHHLPALHRPTLIERVAPYVQDVSRPSRLLQVTESQNPFTVLERLAAPWVAHCTRVLEYLSGNRTGLRRRLDAAGSGASVEQFRAQQIVFGALGLAAGLLLTLAAAVRGAFSPAALLALSLLAGVAGVVGRDVALGRQVKRRQARILLEFPTVAELLALSVGAGEGAFAAMERVARTTDGAMAHEFRRAIAEVNAGAGIEKALLDLSRRVNLLLVTRFVDAMLVCLQNGTPLAAVLRAQASDARAAARRAVMEEGGRREIAMMLPVVFLVLPVTVLFACYPGLAVLTLGGAP